MYTVLQGHADSAFASLRSTLFVVWHPVIPTRTYGEGLTELSASPLC